MKALIFPSERSSDYFLPFLVNITEKLVLQATNTNLLAEIFLSDISDENNDELFTVEMEEYEVNKHETVLEHLLIRGVLNRNNDNSMSFISEDYKVRAEDYEHDVYLKIGVTIFQ